MEVIRNLLSVVPEQPNKSGWKRKLTWKSGDRMWETEDFYNNSSNGSITEDGCQVKTMKFKLVMLIYSS